MSKIVIISANNLEHHQNITAREEVDEDEKWECEKSNESTKKKERNMNDWKAGKIWTD